MGKIIKSLFALGIVGFWLIMNSALLRREYQYQNLDQYRQGITNYLGKELYRERWMGIYRNKDKTAYEGWCPKCARPVRVAIGPDGSDTRFFEAH